jgi:hypothetical protein
MATCDFPVSPEMAVAVRAYGTDITLVQRRFFVHPKLRSRDETETSRTSIRETKRKIRKQYSAEEKIRIVLDGSRGEDSIADLCHLDGIAQRIYYK